MCGNVTIISPTYHQTIATTIIRAITTNRTVNGSGSGSGSRSGSRSGVAYIWAVAIWAEFAAANVSRRHSFGSGWLSDYSWKHIRC
jgi:hypothetical protein